MQSLSGYDSLSNAQKDYLYVNKLLQSDQLTTYLRQVNIEKAEAKQALKVKQRINGTDITVFESSWPSGKDALEKETFEVVDPITPQNIYDSEDEKVVMARWFWDTRRYNLGEAKTYFSSYDAYWKNDEYYKMRDKYNAMGAVAQDRYYKDHDLGHKPEDKLTPEEKQYKKWFWEDWDYQVKIAQDQIAAQQQATREELNKTKWSTYVDIYYDTLKDVPWADFTRRVWWNTGRYTRDQAEEYLKHGQFVSPTPQHEECQINPWNGSTSDILRYLLDYISCSWKDFKKQLDELFGYVETGVLIAVVGLLIAAGYVAYNNRKQLKLAAITSGSYASNLIPGKQYYELKKQKAAAEGTSVSYQIGQDAKQAYNPVGLIGKVSNEYAEQNPNSFTAGLLK